MKSTIAVTVLAATGSAMTASSFIPTGISASCSDFLGKLDTGSALTTCTSALSKASGAFASGGSASDVQPALSALCAPAVSDACSESNIRTTLSSFEQACTAELISSPNDQVKLIYDTLYTVRPMIKAACSKDDSSAYCGAGSAGASNAKAAQKYLGTTTPNATVWANNNVPFLFIQKPASTADCTPCLKQVIAAYLAWESTKAYAVGLAASPLLKGQPELYSSTNSVCGANFFGGTVNVAGGIGNSVAGKANSAEVIKAGGAISALAAVIFGAVALF